MAADHEAGVQLAIARPLGNETRGPAQHASDVLIPPPHPAPAGSTRTDPPLSGHLASLNAAGERLPATTAADISPAATPIGQQQQRYPYHTTTTATPVGITTTTTSALNAPTAATTAPPAAAPDDTMVAPPTRGAEVGVCPTGGARPTWGVEVLRAAGTLIMAPLAVEEPVEHGCGW